MHQKDITSLGWGTKKKKKSKKVMIGYIFFKRMKNNVI